jgi:Uma2 family endonuclease
MSVALDLPMTVAAFLDWERRQPAKHEFDGVGAVAMTGGTAAHAAIQRNLIGLLYSRLRGHRCQAYGSELKIRAGDAVRYPDAFVVCSALPANTLIVTDPVIVFEILSESTSTVDRIDKNQEYRDTPSIRRYVILEQTKVAATVFHRDGEDWVGHLQIGDTVLDLPEIATTLSLIDLYEGVAFPATDVGPDEARASAG